MNPPLNWQEIMRMYNEDVGTDYTDLRTWLISLHEARTNEANEELLGVAHMAFAKQLRKYNIPPKTKGFRRHAA
jgi:hypothetical protein